MFRPPSPDVLAYLDFSVSTTGILAGVKVGHWRELLWALPLEHSRRTGRTGVQLRRALLTQSAEQQCYVLAL